MILYVSGRTDIVAFYSEWFLNRIKEGYVDVRNPFNKSLFFFLKNFPISFIAQTEP